MAAEEERGERGCAKEKNAGATRRKQELFRPLRAYKNVHATATASYNPNTRFWLATLLHARLSDPPFVLVARHVCIFSLSVSLSYPFDSPPTWLRVLLWSSITIYHPRLARIPTRHAPRPPFSSPSHPIATMRSSALTTRAARAPAAKLSIKTSSIKPRASLEASPRGRRAATAKQTSQAHAAPSAVAAAAPLVARAPRNAALLTPMTSPKPATRQVRPLSGKFFVVSSNVHACTHPPKPRALPLSLSRYNTHKKT